jgi:hypothetical protein
MNKSLYEICEEARTPIDSEVSAMREAILKHCHIMAKGGYSSVILDHQVICDIFPFTKPDVSRWFNTVSEALRLIHTEDRIWVEMFSIRDKWEIEWVSQSGQYARVGAPVSWASCRQFRDPQEAMLKFKAKISWEHPPKEGNE